MAKNARLAHIKWGLSEKADCHPLREINLRLTPENPPFVATAMTWSQAMTTLLSPAHHSGKRGTHHDAIRSRLS
jgi:hypothetical protein